MRIQYKKGIMKWAVRTSAVLAVALVAIVAGVNIITAPKAGAVAIYPNQELCEQYGGTWTVNSFGDNGNQRSYSCAGAPSRISALYDPSQELSSFTYYTELASCIAERMKGDIYIEDVIADGGGSVPRPIDWFDYSFSGLTIGEQYKTGFVYPQGELPCDKIADIAMVLWGYGADHRRFLVELGYRYESDEQRWHGPQDGNFRVDDFRKMLALQVYDGFDAQKLPTGTNVDKEGLSNAARYLQNLFIFGTSAADGGCSAQDLGLYPSLNGSREHKTWVDGGYITQNDGPGAVDAIDNPSLYIKYSKARIINTNREPEPRGFVYLYGGSDTVSVPVAFHWPKHQRGETEIFYTCDEILRNIDTLQQDYLDWLALHPEKEVDTGDTCTVNPNGPGCPPPTGSTTCAIEGVGWLVCPVFNFLAGIADSTYGIIQGFLETDITIFDTNSGTFRAWQVMRDFANVGFVIAFLIIVFSQLTSIGISNYGVKKMLPRLIIAAILVNLSYFISQIAVDLSNILGGSLKQLLDSLPVFSGSLYTDSLATGNLFTQVTTFILGGGALVAGAAALGYFGGVGLLLPILLAAVLSIIVTVLILVARQALIILLVIVSPLAFLAMLLPNTENLFKQWRKIFVSMLIIYPVIAVLFGASRVAAAILMQTFSATDNSLGELVALAVMVLPLLVVPSLLKGSLNAVPALGAIANKIQGKANGFLGKTAQESYASSAFGRGQAIRKQERMNVRTRRLSEQLSAGGVRGKLTNLAAGGFSSLGLTKGQRAEKEAITRAAQGTAAAAQSEAVKQEMTVLRAQLGTNSDAIEQHIRNNHTRMSATQMEAASDLMLEAGGVSNYRKIIGDGAIMQAHARSLVESGRRNGGEVRKKAADIADWTSTAEASSAMGGYTSGTVSPTDAKGRTFLELAYSAASGAKLLTMDAETAKLAEPYIDKNLAKQATQVTGAGGFSDAKGPVQEILTRVANKP